MTDNMLKDSLLSERTEASIKGQTVQIVQISAPATPKKVRLISLDVLRGLTIVGMLLVDNMYPNGPAWITHTKWNGLTLADLIFPSFVFIMGMAVPFALSASRPVTYRAITRILGLFGIGVLLNLFEVKFNFHQFRVMGILQRLALCYGGLVFVHAATNYGQKAYRFAGSIVVVACIQIYLAYMLTFQSEQCPPESNLSLECNFGAYLDKKLFHRAHMYDQTDPEGLFTTLTAFVNGFAGYMFCLAMFDNKTNIKKTLSIWTIASFLCALFSVPLLKLMPLNKKIWSISYTFLTIGISGISLTVITLLLDIVGKNNSKYQKMVKIVTTPLIWMGRNPLAIFVSRDLIDDICNSYIVINGVELYQNMYKYLLGSWIDNQQIGSCIFSIFWLLVLFLEAFVLFKKEIFIKL